MRGSSLVLTGDLPGVCDNTISSIARLMPEIKQLELSNLRPIEARKEKGKQQTREQKMDDNVFASALRGLVKLESLVLR